MAVKGEAAGAIFHLPGQHFCSSLLYSLGLVWGEGFGKAGRRGAAGAGQREQGSRSSLRSMRRGIREAAVAHPHADGEAQVLLVQVQRVYKQHCSTATLRQCET